MSTMNELAEQHILASQLRLQHIDELMAKAKAVPAGLAEAHGVGPLLTRVQRDREGAQQALDELRQRSGEDLVERSAGVRGVLETIGLDLERAMAAMVTGGA